MSLVLVVRHEDVPEPPYGLDVLRMRWILFHDLPQTRDLPIDRAVEDLVFAAARELHQLVARERLARMPRLSAPAGDDGVMSVRFEVAEAIGPR